MNEWEKQEIPVASTETANDPVIDNEEPAAPFAAPDDTASPDTEEPAAPAKPKRARRAKKPAAESAAPETPAANHEADRSARYSAHGARRGRYRLAAWVGLVVILLAIVGAVSLIVLGIQIIQKANDHTELMNELADLADPIIEFQPAAFDTLEKADQNTLLLAAIYRLTEAERIRQLRERTDLPAYEQDEYGRLIISIHDVEASFAALFGDTIQPTHRTLNERSGIAYTYEYDKPNACYHVPTSVSSSLHTTVVDKIEVTRDTASIRVGYALTAGLDIDNKGNVVMPTADQIETYRWLTFTQTKTGWILTSVAVETPENAPSTAPATTQPTATATKPATTTTASVTAPTTETTAETDSE